MSGGLWKFKVVPHQQQALERVKSKLKNRALICYAAPVFHKQSHLYSHTINQSIVQNSTFPDVSELKGHSAWYYQSPGANGIANPEFKAINQRPFLERLETFASDQEDRESYDNKNALESLATALLASIKENSEPTFEGARIFDEIISMKRFAEDFDLENDKADVINYLTVHIFAYFYRLNWMVVGR